MDQSLPIKSISTTPKESNDSEQPNGMRYRAHRDQMYDNLTHQMIEDYGFKFDSDVFVYNESRTHLNSVVLNRTLFVPSDSFKEYEMRNGERQLTEACVNKINAWLRFWGKIPEFLEVRAVPGKGFGIFSRVNIVNHTFLGYYAGLRHPLPILNPNNHYYITYGKEAGCIDGQNLTFGNFVSLINDGHDSRHNVVYHDHGGQILVVTCKDILNGEELVVSYGSRFWNDSQVKKLD